MSAGHRYGSSSGLGSAEIERIISDPRLKARLAQRPNIDRSYDLPYLGGYSRDGRTVYIDRHFPAAVKIAGKAANVLPFIILHEHGEKTMMDVLGLPYRQAHVIVTEGLEHPAVRAAGLAPGAYEQALKPYIKADEIEKVKRVPPDLDLSPYIETKDTAVLTRMRAVMNRAQWQRAVAFTKGNNAFTKGNNVPAKGG